MFMGQTGAYKQLTPHLPSANLVSFPVLFSVIGNTIIQIAFQAFIFFWVTYFAWCRYFPRDEEIEGKEIDEEYASS